jgi:hypothetical protein
VEGLKREILLRTCGALCERLLVGALGSDRCQPVGRQSLIGRRESLPFADPPLYKSKRHFETLRNAYCEYNSTVQIERLV